MASESKYDFWRQHIEDWCQGALSRKEYCQDVPLDPCQPETWTGKLFQPLLTTPEKQLLIYPVMRCGETVVQILKEPDLQATCKSYMSLRTGESLSRCKDPYRLIETTKDNQLEPYQYLCHIFFRNTKSHKPGRIEALLPWNVNIKKFQDRVD